MSTPTATTSARDKDPMKTDHSQAVADGAHSHSGPVPAGQRFSSFDLADFPVPTGREEDWRFTPLNRLAGLHLPDSDEARLTAELGRLVEG